MTEQEYNAKLDEINSTAERQRNLLIYEYAISQAIFKVGDIIGYRHTAILVSEIAAYSEYGLVMPTYEGLILKKDLTPRKNGEIGVIYGHKGVTLIK